MVALLITEGKVMKYQIGIDKVFSDVDVAKTESTISVERNGKKTQFTFHKTSSGFVLGKDGKIFHTNLQTFGNEKAVVNVNDKTIDLEWKDPYKLASGAGADSNQNEIKSVMPGRVVKILIKPGDEVKANQPLLVLEAMKMENEIKSHKDGKVTSIKISEGASVEAGTVLIYIE